MTVHFHKDLIGVAVCGGESSRMGMDKSLLVYRDKPQRYYLCDIMKPFCERVFVSCNTRQAAAIDQAYEKIPDLPQYAENGPIGALLSAFTTFPDRNVLFIGCDYPFITTADISRLCDTFFEHGKTVSFYNQASLVAEPLLAIYSGKDFPLLVQRFGEKKLSLKQFLKDVEALEIEPDDPRVLKSVDTPEALQEAVNEMKVS